MKKVIKKKAPKKAVVSKKKVTVLKKAKVLVKKGLTKVASKYKTVPSYAGTGVQYREAIGFPGFRIRKESNGFRIHVSRQLESGEVLRIHGSHVALDIPKDVLVGLIQSLA